MDNKTIEFIEMLADKVRKEYGINEPDFDILQLVKDMGGSTEDFPYINVDSMPIIKKNKDNTFVINVDNQTGDMYNRYKIAVCIGHLFLHMGFRTDNELWERQNTEDFKVFCRLNQIYQAHRFALALLLPKDMLEDAFKVYSNDYKLDVEGIMQHFNLQYSYIYNRAISLGIVA